MTDAPTEREGEGALSKLRRRKVVQWGIAYAVDAPALLTARRMIRNQLGGQGRSRPAASLDGSRQEVPLRPSLLQRYLRPSLTAIAYPAERLKEGPGEARPCPRVLVGGTGLEKRSR